MKNLIDQIVSKWAGLLSFGLPSLVRKFEQENNPNRRCTVHFRDVRELLTETNNLRTKKNKLKKT